VGRTVSTRKPLFAKYCSVRWFTPEAIFLKKSTGLERVKPKRDRKLWAYQYDLIFI
jgi:hypothetical protein